MASDERGGINQVEKSLECGMEGFQTRDAGNTEKEPSFHQHTQEISAHEAGEITAKSHRRGDRGAILPRDSAQVRGEKVLHSMVSSHATSTSHTSALETLVRTAVESLVTSLPVANTTTSNADVLVTANENMAKVVGLEEVVSVVNEGVVHTSSMGQRSALAESSCHTVISDDLRSAVNVMFDEMATSGERQGSRVVIVDQHSASMVHGLGTVDHRPEDDDDGQDLGARQRKPTQPLSPEMPLKQKKKKRSPTTPTNRGPRHNSAQPFKCDLCGSPYVINPSRRGNRMKTSTHHPSPRHKVDMSTGNTLTLCNACGLSFDRPKKPRKEKYIASPEEKKKYLEEASQFAQSLVEGLGDPDAERLCCPHFKFRPCGCLQSYIIGDGMDMNASRRRATEMLELLKQAKLLGFQKCYEQEIKDSVEKTKRAKSIGLGNGQRKSKEFEEFILAKRKYLRKELKLCERATQRVLVYSNNFLHKKLKTDPDKPIRVERQKGKAAMGKLKVIEDLPKERCCVDNCVMIAVSHAKLLHQWRTRAVSGQTEARRALAEMLTPSGGARSNCYKFISWVTGCSHSTIGRVNEQMKETGGDREPPEHGLIKWWRENPKPKKPKIKPPQPIQTETVQQVALQQIQQVMPQVTNILQAAVSSAGLTAVMMQPNVSSAVPLTTINTSQLAQAQLLPTGTLQVHQGSQQQLQTQTAMVPTQIQTQQHVQIQQQQLQYQQQIQQLQLQQLQLQQAQQHIQQQIQQAQAQQQQIQAQATQHIQPQIQQQLQPVHHQQQLQQQQQQQQQSPQQHTHQSQPTAQQQDQPMLVQHQQATQQAETQSQQATVPTIATTLAGDQGSQATPLTTESFLTADTFHLLNVVQPGQVVTIPVMAQAPAITHTVPVSLIQTSGSGQAHLE